MKDLHLFPIPREKLIKRFEKAFTQITKDKSTTILALPHTGRTSNLRFLLANEKLLEESGLEKNRKLVFIDIDTAGQTYISFLSELLKSLSLSKLENKFVLRALLSQDSYLVTQAILNEVKVLTEKFSLAFIVTLNVKAKDYLSDLDNLFVQIQKSVNQPVSILWSVDTSIFSFFAPDRSSSTFGSNLFFYPTFDEAETHHAIKRIALTKGVKLPSKKLVTSFEKTGGIAGLFHAFVNRESFEKNTIVEKNLNELKDELAKNPDYASFLTTKTARKVIETAKKNFNFHEVKFTTLPSAQEINLVKFFKSKENEPVERDEIAKTIWGKSWEKKYSDWALDKAIERLRKNTRESEYKIITVRNFGYQLIKL